MAICNCVKFVGTRRLAASTAPDTKRLDWLEGEMKREQDHYEAKRTFRAFGPPPASLFRRNVCITREAIDLAMANAAPPSGDATGGET